MSALSQPPLIRALAAVARLGVGYGGDSISNSHHHLVVTRKIRSTPRYNLDTRPQQKYNFVFLEFWGRRCCRAATGIAALLPLRPPSMRVAEDRIV